MYLNYGINLEKKRQLIEGRLCNFVSENGYHSFDEYFDYIFMQNSKEELAILLNKLTTNHTFFMREYEHFEFFEQIILKQLSKEVKDGDLRIWSAGCSSGEEPYTLAMIMANFFADDKRRWDKKILATDISQEVLSKARLGIYTKEDLEEIKESWKRNYFHKLNKEEYQINDLIKNEVIFRSFNLMENFPFKKKFHVIFCRNVMIYFDQKTKNQLIQRFYDMTQDGGYLFIGMSESLAKDSCPYKYVMPSVYRKG